MPATIGSTIVLMLSAASLANEEWSCRSLGAGNGYQCPTIECELTSGDYLGASVGLPVGDLLDALCKASKRGAASETAVIEFRSEVPGMNSVAVGKSLCKPGIPTSEFLGLIVATDSCVEDDCLISRLLVEIQESKVTRVAREVRSGKCDWERGL
mgnify:CR=1 FL=1